jgi:arylsulfatase A-like enzyme
MQSEAAGGRPNIVLILADDLGVHDLGCYGADLHETPAIDGLAREGMQFLRAYSPSPVCTPTRASLMTGKHPARLRMTIWSEGSLKGPTDRRMLQADSLHDLPRTEMTLAKHLQAAGYLTASVGKWHLGDANHAPEAHGFDVNIGGTHWGAPASFFFPYRGSGRFGAEMRYVPHLEFGREGEYLTDRLTDEALRVIDAGAAKHQPFFLYLAHHAPHTPIEAKASDVTHFESKLRPGLFHRNPVYAAMVRSLDESVGRVLGRLRERGVETNTLVVFASDNGGYLGTDARQTIPVTTNAPLRSGKGSLYEGGIRVPLLVKWPGVTRAASTSAEPIVLTDLFRTLMTAAGLAAPAGLPEDGVDLAGLMREPGSKLGREALYFHYPHYYHAPKTAPASAVQVWPWKLVEHLEDGRVELFDLGKDPGEAKDLSGLEAGRVAGMRGQLERWRVEVGAAMPTLNPAFKGGAGAE